MPWQAFRLDEDVDIKAIDSGGYYVGWNVAGEYRLYTVDVQTPGESSHNTPPVKTLTKV